MDVKKQVCAAMAFAVFLICLWGRESPSAQTSARSAETARQQCAALDGTAIPRASISLPTSGGVVVSASFMTATDRGNSNGEFCRVLGSIHPVDPTAPPIKFEVNLPGSWNNRLLQLGGGGFDGSLVTGLDRAGSFE